MFNIKSYKNREIDIYKKVSVYRCLNRKGFVFSIKQNGLVIGHTDYLILKNCEFIINKAGKSRCIKEKTRNVHAWISGFILHDKFNMSELYPVKYNPYSNKGFIINNIEVEKSDIVIIKNKQIKAKKNLNKFCLFNYFY